MKALVIAANELRRLLRWRANIFFLFVLPMLIILLLGAAFGGGDKVRVGVLGGQSGPLAREFVSDLDAQQSLEVRRYASAKKLQRAVARGEVDAGVELPAAYDAGLLAGRNVAVGFFARPDATGLTMRATVQSVVDDQARVIVPARVLANSGHVPLAGAIAHSRAAAASVPHMQVVVEKARGGAYSASAGGRFEQGASTQLLLFVFFNSLTGAAWMIETRRLGIARRMLSTPTPMREIVTGQVLGRMAIAVFQALLIILGTLILFGVDWGDPLGTGVVVLAFCMVGTGVGVLVGSIFSNEQQAAPVALLLGLGLAALGGSMAPLDVFPSAARKIAHLTPHAWANDAFSKLLDHGGDLVTVLPQVGVLLGFAAVSLAVATWRLRRVLTA